MYRAAICLRTCQHPRLGVAPYQRNTRLLSNASVGYQVDDEGQVIGKPSTWDEEHGRAVGRRPLDSQDVILDDLSATLEAHRSRNSASVIRKLDTPSHLSIPFQRLSVGNMVIDTKEEKRRHLLDSDLDRSGQETKTEDLPLWPADSVQAQEGYRIGGRKRPRMTRGGNFDKSANLEYTGVPLSPTHSWTLKVDSIPLLQRPWLAYLEKRSEDNLERLSDEIRAYEAYIRLTPAEETAAQLVMSDIKSITRDSLRRSPLTALGSRTTGLATPLSDFDLTFSIPAFKRSRTVSAKELVPQAVSSLRRVEKDLRASIKLANTELVYARIPIIETKHRATGLKIQIQTMATHQSAQEYCAAYLNELPSLRPLYILLRYCLEIRGLSTVFEGGVGSYSLLMMIVTALKHSRGVFASHDLAGQLLYVLYFYGSADLYKDGFSANPPRIFDKSKKAWSIAERIARAQDPQLDGIDDIVCKRDYRKPYLLSLQDPANDFNDLGKNSYAIKHVQATFNEAHKSVLLALDGVATKSMDQNKGETWSCLDLLVRADYQAFEARRSKVERNAYPQSSNDHKYSPGRIKDDFLNRVEFYKGTIDEYRCGAKPRLLIKRPESVLVKRPLADPSLRGWRLIDMENRINRSSRAHIAYLWVEFEDTRSRLAEVDGLPVPPLLQPDLVTSQYRKERTDMRKLQRLSALVPIWNDQSKKWTLISQGLVMNAWRSRRSEICMYAGGGGQEASFLDVQLNIQQRFGDLVITLTEEWKEIKRQIPRADGLPFPEVLIQPVQPTSPNQRRKPRVRRSEQRMKSSAVATQLKRELRKFHQSVSAIASPPVNDEERFRQLVSGTQRLGRVLGSIKKDIAESKDTRPVSRLGREEGKSRRTRERVGAVTEAGDTQNNGSVADSRLSLEYRYHWLRVQTQRLRAEANGCSESRVLEDYRQSQRWRESDVAVDTLNISQDRGVVSDSLLEATHRFRELSLHTQALLDDYSPIVSSQGPSARSKLRLFRRYQRENTAFVNFKNAKLVLEFLMIHARIQIDRNGRRILDQVTGTKLKGMETVQESREPHSLMPQSWLPTKSKFQSQATTLSGDQPRHRHQLTLWRNRLIAEMKECRDLVEELRKLCDATTVKELWKAPLAQIEELETRRNDALFEVHSLEVMFTEMQERNRQLHLRNA